MKANESPQSAGKQSSNLESQAGETSQSGASLAPPAFQLKASSLADLVSPVANLARNEPTAQLKSLTDYNDKDKKHDPSNVSDSDIQGTDEYKALMNAHYLIPTTDPSILYTPEEILLACRLMLRAMREGTTVDASKDAKTYLDRARMQVGTSDQAESLDGKLKWSSTFPGVDNTNFGDWLLSGGAEPDASTGVMNCWELVMFSAFKAGFASKSGLTTVYKAFASDLAKDVGMAVTNFENALRQGKEQVFDPKDADSPKPLKGDIVIFNTLAEHVAIATGGTASGSPEIMSLWTQNSKKVYKTSVDELLKETKGPVRFYSPKWN